MLRKLGVLLAAFSLTVAALVGGAGSASASVPYSWFCYKAGARPVQVFTPGGVGYWTAYRGYRCVGGYWSWV